MNDNNREILTTKIIIREINNRYVKSIVLRIIVFILFLCSLSIYFVIENFYLLKLLLNFGYVAVLFIMGNQGQSGDGSMIDK